MDMTKTCELLRCQQQTLGQLLSVLQQECDALCEKNSEAIVSRAMEKQQLLDRVDELFLQYSRHIDPAAMPQDEQARQLWQEVKTLTDECSQQNQVNGNMIATGHQFARRALSLLRGETVEGNACYSRDGKTDQVINSRTIAKA